MTPSAFFRIVEVLEPYKRQSVFILERQVNSFMKVVLIGRLKLSSTDIFYNVHAYLFSLFLILARPAIMKALDSICVWSHMEYKEAACVGEV